MKVYVQIRLRRVLGLVFQGRAHIFRVLSLFTASCVLGFWAPGIIGENTFESARGQFTMWMSDYGAYLWSLAFFIIIKNTWTTYLWMRLGTLYGFLPYCASFFNGTVIGAFVKWTSHSVGNYHAVWQMLPHGIFEVPAFILAFGMGVQIGSVRFSGQRGAPVREAVKKANLVFVYLSIPLLVLAGFIEASFILY